MLALVCLHLGAGAATPGRAASAERPFDRALLSQVSTTHTPKAAKTEHCHATFKRGGNEAWRCVCRHPYGQYLAHHNITENERVGAGISSLNPGANWLDVFITRSSEHLARKIHEAGFELCGDGSVFNAVESLLHPGSSACYPHLPVYALFPPTLLSTSSPAATDGSLVREWLGNVRPWDWDCSPNTYREPYVAYSPMRLVDCLRGMPVAPSDLPVVDEEYFELADVLTAVAAAPVGGTFTVVELGARYAPWAVRAMVAAKMLGRSRDVHAVILEPLLQHIRWSQDNFRLNGISESQYTIFRGFYNNAPPRFHNASTYSLAQLLADVESVDLLDMDVQGAEMQIGREADERALQTKVRRVHIEGHSIRRSQAVLTYLKRLGFVIVRQAATGLDQGGPGLHSTPVGLVVFRGGYIYASNPRFENTLQGSC